MNSVLGESPQRQDSTWPIPAAWDVRGLGLTQVPFAYTRISPRAPAGPV
jgi:hypothetical protein